jgi:serine O-acetyltransferase
MSLGAGLASETKIGRALVSRSNATNLSLVPGDSEGLYDPADTLWERLRQEAEAALSLAPMLAPLFVGSILDQPSFEAAIFHRVSARLHNDVVSLPLLVETFARAAAADPQIALAIRADLVAVVERDPACERIIEPFLYFKGFHAIQTHRLAHWLWSNGERDFAFYLQSRSSDLFQTDIHPAARFGNGVLLDHATGLVVGETAVVEDEVSLLQDVTLGGTGKEHANRHPKIRRGAMIGAGAKILGNIEVGAYARIAAGSVVLRPVEAYSTVAGVPARMIRTGKDPEPSRQMDQILSDISYESFTYTI